MRFFDLVEEHDAEGLLPDGIGQLAADIVAHIAGRRADEALIGMLGREFRHIETNIGGLIAEKQAGQRLGKLGFANPGRTGKEQSRF